jgi:transposase-like protein
MVYKFSTTIIKHSVPRKLHILAQLSEGLLTNAQAINEYNLSPKLLRAWRKWRHLHILKKYNPRTVRKPKKTDAQKLVEAERRMKELEKELKWQTLRADTLDKFIDISEEMLDITIRKKPGSKQ